MIVDDKPPTPLYHQIFRILRNKILDRKYGHGEYLPSEGETTRAFKVSRITSKRALNKLAEESLVVRERGRRARVAYSDFNKQLPVRIEGRLENIAAMGLKTEVELLNFVFVTAREKVARALKCRLAAFRGRLFVQAESGSHEYSNSCSAILKRRYPCRTRRL